MEEGVGGFKIKLKLKMNNRQKDFMLFCAI